MKKRFTEVLPADENRENYSRKVVNAGFSYVKPKLPSQPSMLCYNTALANSLEFNFSEAEALDILSGKKTYPNQESFAMCYGGHQFGHWAGQLGDGRAINIAEIIDGDKQFTLQLKGAGPTPYSRSADGFAVLRSSIREYLCSEAMFHLGVPTTRALSLVLSGDEVMRDVLYNGNPKLEKGAIVSRVANSFIRFGNFEMLAARKEFGNLQLLTDLVIQNHYPDNLLEGKESYLQFFKSVSDNTLKMIIHWERIGFVHGVMNTDNMSILGDTIDYGPYGWLDNFDPSWTPNTTDAQNRRYRFGNQASIALWNLTKLANALYPLIEEAEGLESILEAYKSNYFKQRDKMFCDKLGVSATDENAKALIEGVLLLLEKSSMDMTLFWRNLAQFKGDNIDGHIEKIKADSYLSSSEFDDLKNEWHYWLSNYSDSIDANTLNCEERKFKMNNVNPKYIIRNYMAQLAIEDAEKGDYSLLHELEELLKNPYDEQGDMEKWFVKRPDWAENKVGASMLSCSS